MGKLNASELRGKKEALVKEWEACFEKSINDVFSEKGLKRFWSSETSLEDADAMLVGAAIHDFVDGLFTGDDVTIIIGGVTGKKKDEPCNVKNGNPYRIIRKKDNYFFDNEFETEQAAKDFIEESVRHSPYTIDDFLVVKVM